MITLDCVVVGAGHAGLGVAALLMREGLRITVLERGRIAETWRTQRWDSFQLNTPAWMNQLPGGLLEDAPRDSFATREQFVAALEDYARRLALPVEAGVTVTEVERAADGQGFLVRGRDASGDARAWHARAVVAACGAQRVPRYPAFHRVVPPGIAGLHSADYRCAAALPEGAVVVVGTAQSGCQIAEDLLAAGRTVYLCASRVGRVVRRYRGRDILEWWAEAGIWDQTEADLEDPAMRFAAQPQVSGAGRYGRTVSLQQLARAGVHLLGRALGVNEGILQLDGRVGEYVRFADERSDKFRQDVDAYLARTGTAAPPPEPDPADAPAPELWALTGPPALDLRAAGVGAVIWCTGFTGDFAWIRLPVLDANTLPVHQGGVTAVPGFYFLGLPWMRHRKSGIVYGVMDDAAHIVQEIARHLTPERERS